MRTANWLVGVLYAGLFGEMFLDFTLGLVAAVVIVAVAVLGLAFAHGQREL